MTLRRLLIRPAPRLPRNVAQERVARHPTQPSIADVAQAASVHQLVDVAARACQFEADLTDSEQERKAFAHGSTRGLIVKGAGTGEILFSCTLTVKESAGTTSAQPATAHPSKVECFC